MCLGVDFRERQHVRAPHLCVGGGPQALREQYPEGVSARLADPRVLYTAPKSSGEDEADASYAVPQEGSAVPQDGPYDPTLLHLARIFKQDPVAEALAAALHAVLVMPDHHHVSMTQA